jgi:hypothetical protein
MYNRSNFKSPIHFYTGLEKRGRLIQADYIVIIQKVITLN